MIIPLIGFPLAAGFGIYYTEPIERGGVLTRTGNSAASDTNAQSVSQRSSDHRYDYSRSRTSDVYLFLSRFDLGELAEGAGDMDEFCLVLLLSSVKYLGFFE